LKQLASRKRPFFGIFTGMWRSRMFWQLFGTYGVLIVFSVGLVGLVVAGRAEENELESIAGGLWTAAAAAAVLALGLAFWLARRITRPVQELTTGAQRIAAGAYGHRVYAEGPDEVGQLARTFNHMSDHLAAQFSQLDDDREQLRAVLGSMVEGVVAVDRDQRILFANDRAGELLDFAIRPAVGRRLYEVVRQRGIQEVVQATLNDGSCDCPEVSLTGPAAKTLTVQVGRLPGTPPRGIVLVLHDTTELRRLERVRQEFVANVSHELKTPLSVIKACVETLIDGGVDDVSIRGTFLERIHEQADRLHHLILDMISLARIETELEAFGLEATPLEPAVRGTVEHHLALAKSKNQVLEAVPPDGAGEVVAWADEEAVRQILDNLVDNALKYTPAGGTVQVRWGAENGQAFLEVQDTGIGIPEDALGRIFERFYRVDKARSRQLGGTGLGLSIVKHLAQAMHGSVQAQSKVGQGSTFTVFLPTRADS
jgi:two-component system phosphate regulon sensor histidine kinase PhoR